MTRRRSKGLSESRLTPVQRVRLRHLRAAEQLGETINAYAERQGLSVHRLYQAGKHLRDWLGRVLARYTNVPVSSTRP